MKRRVAVAATLLSHLVASQRLSDRTGMKKPPHTRGQAMGIIPVYSADIGLEQVANIADGVTHLSSDRIVSIDAYAHAVHAD